MRHFTVFKVLTSSYFLHTDVAIGNFIVTSIIIHAMHNAEVMIL